MINKEAHFSDLRLLYRRYVQVILFAESQTQGVIGHSSALIISSTTRSVLFILAYQLMKQRQPIPE